MAPPGHIVEHGLTRQMFHKPVDPRTEDYVNGRVRLIGAARHSCQACLVNSRRTFDDRQ